MNLNDTPKADYEADFALWLEAQLMLLRERRFDKLDMENLLEELGGLLGRQYRELRHRLIIITSHLLKCEFQPQRKGRSWRSTLATQRIELEELFEQSPSLRRQVAAYAEKAYLPAVRLAAKEMGIDPSVLPGTSPYTESQLLDLDFEP